MNAARRRKRLLLVVPCFGRYELTRIVLHELRFVIDSVRPYGLDAQVAVVADDENLTEAQARGFVALERDNEYLGARFNDGYQHALHEAYDYVHATGSDTFIDPRLFLQLGHGLPLAHEVLCGRYLTAFAPGLTTVPARPSAKDDKYRPRRADLRIDRVFGNSIYPVAMIEPLDGRPCEETRTRGCDTSTRSRIEAANPELRVIYQDHHQLERINFSSGVTQVTDFTTLVRTYNGPAGVYTANPWANLDQTYPAPLVQAVRDYYHSGRAHRA